MHLTEKSVSKIEPGAKRKQFPDDAQPGFALRVEPNGAKRFCYYAKVNRLVRFRAIGDFPEMTVADARAHAAQWAAKAKEWKRTGYQPGHDPFKQEERIEPTAPTFAQLLGAYVEHHIKETANRPERAESQARWLAKKYFDNWTHRAIDSLTVEDMLAVKNACGKKRFAANRCVEFIRALFNWSARRKDGKTNFWRVDNPAKDVSFYDEKPRERFLQPAELAAFNKALDEEPHRDLKDFLILALTTGARKGDLLTMRWQDIQWERSVWRVPYPKSGQSYDVSLLPAAVAVLKRRRREAADSDDFVFPGVGETKHIVDLKKPWEAFRVRAGVADIRIHDLRRTVGSYLAISGVSLQTIGAALGHRNLQSTEVYARLHDSVVREARESGQAKMLEMMKAAKRRARITTPKQRLLKAALPA